jgi:hypothetical protein
LADVSLGGGVAGWAAAAVSVPVTAGVGSCARAGLPQSIAASASGLAAATNREREEVITIIVPLKPAYSAGCNSPVRGKSPSPNGEEYQTFAAAKRLKRLYIRIQRAKI